MLDDRAAPISGRGPSTVAPSRRDCANQVEIGFTLGDSVAVLGHISHASRSAGRRAKTVLANVAPAWRGDREGRSRRVQAPRQARSVALPQREPGMTRALLAGFSWRCSPAMPAAADHCPPRPILSGAAQSVRWAQHAPRLSLCSRSGLALRHSRQRR